jgi:aryl-phospho-beta-D-glucosidase BglC (GH1 family)
VKLRLAVLFLLLTASSSQAFSQSTVPASRLAHLRRGINTSAWFAQAGDIRNYTREHLETFVTADDIALIQSMGFDNVRLSVNPEPMFHNKRPDEISGDFLAHLDNAVKMILDHGLAVVIDMHPESDFKAKLVRNEDDYVQQFADFWRALAQHYLSWDADRVFFEVLNEPEFRDRSQWAGVQAKLVAAIREGAPKHTIIAAGANWSSDDELVVMEPVGDRNVIYNFHFYEPFLFTHQGAGWTSYNVHWTRGLRYPSTPESVAPVAASVPDPLYRLQITRYGQDRWNAERIEAEVNQVAEWAKQHGVPVVCNEFGVYRAYSDPKDRVTWISDFRKTLEKHGIGWAMWDYAGGFGVVVKKDGKANPDDAVLGALGLK